jgi:FMN phosphatase YigB (HAD superfamily)
MAKIEAVIFDWGGVLIDNPAPGLKKYCADVLGVGVEAFASEFSGVIEEFMAGVVSEREFWHVICSGLGVEVPGESLWGRAFAAVYCEKAEVFGLAERLGGKGYRVGFLSNTEMPSMAYFLRQGYGCFDATVFSCAEKCSKPGEQIYNIAAERLGVGCERCVFIDDKEHYAEGARKAGMRAIVFKNYEQMAEELAGMGVKADK